MTTATGLLTAEDFAALPTEGLRLELIRGEIQTMAPAFGDHGKVAMTLSGYVTHYVQSKKLGSVYAAETGFLIARNPDTVRAPDFAFIQASRVTPATEAAFWIPVIPDLVVEVVSSGDRPKAVAEKVNMWLDVGVQLVWVVYPAQREVSAHRPGQPEQRLSVGDMLDGSDVISGFTLPVAEIFA
ncbi:MAG TPA: Uma2 family endonuclease [Ktedonobacterales bacterium]|nr:Uma2 family endonuclease [Ktedonobacterales bacterium]